VNAIDDRGLSESAVYSLTHPKKRWTSHVQDRDGWTRIACDLFLRYDSEATTLVGLGVLPLLTGKDLFVLNDASGRRLLIWL
jgi:hypothetical protein